MLTGELPEVNPRSPSGCAAYGHEDFVSYVVWACERALERGLLPHTNLGVLSRDDLARLREVTASQGLMLESIEPGPRRPPGLADEASGACGCETIDAAGELRIPFTSGILVGIGETRGRAGRGARGARRVARAPRPHPGGDPPELRPAPELLRARGGGDRG